MVPPQRGMVCAHMDFFRHSQSTINPKPDKSMKNPPDRFSLENQNSDVPSTGSRNGFKQMLAKIGIGSFAVSLFVHFAFVLIAVFFLFKWVTPPVVETQTWPEHIGGGGGGNNGELAHKIKKTVSQAQSHSAVGMRITVNNSDAICALPVEAVLPSLPSLSEQTASKGLGGGVEGGKGLGKGPGNGPGHGPGTGPGSHLRGFSSLSPIIQGRCSASERMRMIREAGGNEAVEEKVKKSLDWLKSQQNADGSWGDTRQVAMTGLALLCYLGHCEDTSSNDYGVVVSKAIGYLVNVGMANNGKLASNMGENSWCYEHGIATYALAEALAFSRTLKFPNEDLKSAVTKAGQIIVDGQNVNGSWDYKLDASSSRNDLSVTGWQMQALKAVKSSGVDVKGVEATIRAATKYISRKNSDQGAFLDDGMFVYSGGTHSAAMSAVGVLCLQQSGKGNSAESKSGIRYIFNGLKQRTGEAKGAAFPGQEVYAFRYTSNCDLYAFYYASQAMRNAGGSEWAAMNKAILEEILPNQAVDGSFAMPAKMPHFSNKIYCQCLNTLIMEVYYRFLPATSSGSGHGFSGLE